MRKRATLLVGLGWMVFLSIAGITGAAATELGCPRPAVGGVVEEPPALFSKGGVLDVTFEYETAVDGAGPRCSAS